MKVHSAVDVPEDYDEDVERKYARRGELLRMSFQRSPSFLVLCLSILTRQVSNPSAVSVFTTCLAKATTIDPVGVELPFPHPLPMIKYISAGDQV